MKRFWFFLVFASLVAVMLAEVRVTTDVQTHLQPKADWPWVVYLVNEDLFSYNCVTITTTQLTTDLEYQGSHNLKYPWYVYETLEFSTSREIMLGDLTTSLVSRITNDDDEDLSPGVCVFGGQVYVAYQKNEQIYLWTSISGSVFISAGVNPVLKDGVLAWSRNGGDASSIGYRFLGEASNRAISISLCRIADVGSNYIICQQYRRPGDTYIFTIPSGSYYTIAGSGSDGGRTDPKKEGSTIVFSETRYGSIDVFKYDETTASLERFTYGDAWESYACISNSFVFWQDGRNGHDDIYYAAVTEDLSCFSGAEESVVPTDFAISVYPNPFNSTVNFYGVPRGAVVEIFNIASQKVGEANPDGSWKSQSSGVFFARCEIDGQTSKKKLVCIE